MSDATIISLMRDAKREVYQFIDSQYRPLPKNLMEQLRTILKGLQIMI